MAAFEPPVRVRVLRVGQGAPSDQRSADCPQPVHLSPRQLACLNRVAQGDSSNDIAKAFGLSVRTVNQHIGDACLRLGVRRRTQAAVRAVQLGLIAS